jgi:radical SAM superfamily enzyme YgiQ (UPF0313 family)
MQCDVLLASVWTNPVHVDPSYQAIRDEIAACGKVLMRRVVGEFLTRHADRADRYTEMVRYQDQYPFTPGLLSVAAVLEEAGYRVNCVSLDVEREEAGGAPGWLEAVVARLCAGTRLAVGVSAVTPEYPRAIRFLATVKRLAPRLKTMIGGTHVTYIDEEPALDPNVDVVVRGEGEYTALEILNRWDEGGCIDEVAGTTLKVDGRVCRNADRQLCDLTCIPMPAYHLLGPGIHERIHITPTFSRGCPFQCSYCVESVFWGRRVRHKDPVRFAEELRYIAEELDWRFIHIADSTFGIDRAAVSALCDELERRKIDALFSVNVRPDVFHYLGEDLVRRLFAVGFVEFYVGMESADDALVASLHRRQNYSVLLSALQKMKEIGIPFVKLYIFVGAPGDTHESLQMTLNAIRSLHEQGLIYYATGKYFVPTPGTPAFHHSRENGIEIITADWERYERYDFPPVFRHAKLSAFELEHYLALMQAAQLSAYRAKMGRDNLNEDRIRAWVQKNYIKRIYL